MPASQSSHIQPLPDLAAGFGVVTGAGVVGAAAGAGMVGASVVVGSIVAVVTVWISFIVRAASRPLISVYAGLVHLDCHLTTHLLYF